MLTLYMIACVTTTTATPINGKKSLTSCIRNDKMSLLFVKRERKSDWLYVNVYLSNNRPEISWTNTRSDKQQYLQVAGVFHSYLHLCVDESFGFLLLLFCVVSLSLSLFPVPFLSLFCFPPSPPPGYMFLFFQRFQSLS